MTTTTWEPVGQEMLEHVTRMGLPGDTWYAMAAELLAARALLVALVEAQERTAAALDNDDYDAASETEWEVRDAIRAHVQRLKETT